MPARDLSLLIRAAQEVADIARGYVRGGVESWEKPGGAGPVTAADLAVNDRLAEILRSARPDYGWLSEESEDDPQRLDREHVFIVDPIDGTRSFIEGSNVWAHSVAVVRAGVVTAAVVYLPMLDKLYAAAEGQGATLNGAPMMVGARHDLSGATMLAGSFNFLPQHWRDGLVPEVNRAFRPSLAYRLGLVAEGRYDAMMTLKPAWEWDIAAGELILREAGARTSDRRGEALRFNAREPKVDGVIAANPGLHEALMAALAR